MQRAVGFWGTPREWAKDLAIATGIGVFLGVIGPFGSFNGGPIELRVFYWTGNIWVGYFILALVIRAGIRLAARLDLPVWFALALSVAIGALPLSMLVGWFATVAWPGARGEGGQFGLWYAETLALSEPLSFAYYFLAYHGLRQGPTARPAPAQRTTASPPTFLSRLPPRLGTKLLCLQMEDHYVRAHTQGGSELILMPLKQAIADLQDTDGLQVHRSWWVARDAVVEPVRNGRSLGLRLTNGLVVPVSRSSVAALREAGWLGPSGS